MNKSYFKGLFKSLATRFADKQLVEENKWITGLLAKKIIDQTTINEMALKGSHLILNVEGGMCKIFADAFAQQFIDSGAVNYFEASFSCDKLPGELLIVTIQKASGKTPGQFRAEAEARCAELESKLSKGGQQK